MTKSWKPFLPTAYLVAAGDAGDIGFLKNISDAHIIGVDGGADALTVAGITPHAVMGDLDSVRGEFQNLIELSDQNETDLEKSIEYLLVRGVKHFIICGALGGPRMDHHIANLDLLTKYAPQCRICMIAGDTVIEGLSAENTAPVGLEFSMKPESTFSVLPWGGAATATIRGAKYELEAQEIQPGTHGVGNTAIGDKLHIQIHSGLVRLVRTENK